MDGNLSVWLKKYGQKQNNLKGVKYCSRFSYFFVPVFVCVNGIKIFPLTDISISVNVNHIAENKEFPKDCPGPTPVDQLVCQNASILNLSEFLTTTLCPENLPRYLDWFKSQHSNKLYLAMLTLHGAVLSDKKSS